MGFKELMLSRWGLFTFMIIGLFFLDFYSWPTKLMSFNTLTKLIAFSFFGIAFGIAVWQDHHKND
ncbi:hypothetical protein ACFQ22_11615 [Lentilactobacillus raoultii]|uniref:Uncharacterized protein n=1 Tax=Lentilactobacillus raoultii TaxID=1987503 RepID=A0ABW3PLR9_9LACO|nr:hypothetical protein [Lentilactobacillus raoultii]